MRPARGELHPESRWSREIAVFAAVLVMVGLFVWLVPSRMNAQIEEHARERARGLAQVLSSALGAALEFDDPEEAGRVLALLDSQSDAEVAIVRHADGRTLASWRPGSSSGDRVDPPPADGQVEVRGSHMVIAVPVRSTGGTAGRLVASFDARGLAGEKRANWLAVIALVLIGAGGLAALVARLFVRRRRAERALADEKAKFWTLVEGMPEALIIHERGQLTFANSAARALFELGEPGDRSIQGTQPLEAFNAAVAAGASNTTVRVERDGRTVHLEIRRFSPAVEDGSVSITLARDVSDERALQDRLALSDRLASIGTLATGVAHEINNPLTYILSNLEFVAHECEALGPGADGQAAALNRELLEDVKLAVSDARRGAIRVRNIVGDMRKLARKDFGERAPVDPSAVASAAAQLARAWIGRRATLTVELAEVPPVMASESQLSQVIVNLVQNAADAIPPDAPPERRHIRVATRALGDGAVEMIVSDTGTGIAPDVRDKIFDPFFTTKPVGVGTGLGLAICHGIVRAHGGTLDFETEVGVGTSMRVVLPAAAEGQVPVVAEAAGSESCAGRILVVDDEVPVASATARLLRGGDTEVETSPRRVLERLQGGERFDLILCDVRMPDMNGPELLEAVRGRVPDLARVFVFMTGAVDERSEADLARLGVPVLQKPFDRASLRRFVSAQLDRLGRAA